MWIGVNEWTAKLQDLHAPQQTTPVECFRKIDK